MQCRGHVAQLKRQYQDFQAVGADVLVILGDTPDRALRYSESLHTPFPVLADPERDV